MTGLLWLPPPEKHLSATYRTLRGLRDKNRASLKIKDSKIWKANVGTVGPGNLLTFETPGYTIEGKSLLYMNTEISQPCAAPSMMPGRSSS